MSVNDGSDGNNLYKTVELQTNNEKVFIENPLSPDTPLQTLSDLKNKEYNVSKICDYG